MKNWLSKKTRSFILASLFAVGGFGVFTEIAYANPHVSPPTLPTLKTLIETQRLGLPQGTLLYDVRELDDGLYTNTYEGNPPAPIYQFDYPVDPAQIETILDNIKNDGGVIASLNKFNYTDQTWQTLNEQCNNNYAPIFANCHVAAAVNETTAIQLEKDLAAATYARDSALEALSIAVPLAREHQQELINSYVATNKANDLYMSTANTITSSEEAAQSALATQEADITSQTSPYTPSTALQTMPSAAEQAALRQAQKDIVDQLTNDPLAVRMQDQCSFMPAPLGKGINITPCIATVIYSLVYKPTMYVLMGSGYLFDKFLELSIDSNFVNQAFVTSAWGTIRDFSNMLFIFILLYTGVMTILGATDWRKVVLQVIFIALIINFSLFFTKVIIDAGNILAVGVRSAIASGVTVSEGIAAGFQPQKFAKVATTGDTSGGDAIVVFLVATVVSGFAAYIFFEAAILFARRVIVFWALMILSPFAFVSTALPGKANKFGEWLHELTSQALVAPVFLFFIYLIMKAISANGGILNQLSGPGGDGWFNSLIVPSVIAMLIIVSLQKALEFTQGMAGSTGGVISGLVKSGIGIAAGVATGGAAMAGRKIIGGYAARQLASGTLKAGSGAEKAAQWATRASFDVRNAPIPKFAAKGLGSLGINIGKGSGAGGVEKAEKDRVQAALKAAESAKANIFQEQGVYSRPEDVAAAVASHLAEKNEASTAATLELSKQVKNLAQAQEKDRGSEAWQKLSAAETAYKQAEERAQRDRGTEREGESTKELSVARETLESAKTNHSATPTAMAVKSTMSALEKAKKAQKDAEENLKKAASLAEDSIEKQSAWVIEQANKVRINAYADIVESGGIFIGGKYISEANAFAAAKIRKGDKPSKKTAKELMAELLEETGEKKKEEPKAEAKH